MNQVTVENTQAQSLWDACRFKNLILIDRMTLIDESANFASNPYVIKDNLRYRVHYVGEVEFKLVAYFCEPRSREDVERYFANELPRELTSPDLINSELAEYMNAILSLGVLTDGGERHDLIRTSGGKAGAIVFHAPPIQRHDKVVLSFPSTIAINLTERCNLACLHCSVGSNPSVSTKDDLTREELHRLFDSFDEYGLENVRLTGGEPMIRPDFWEILEDATTNRRFSVTLFTNGTRLNEEGVERLRAIRARMGSRFLVHISLDGGRPESHDYLRNRKGNFERVVRTMRMLHERGVHFYVESVLHERSATVEDVEAMCELVAPLGVSYISLHPGEMIGTGEGETTLFFTRDFLVDFGNRLEPVVAKWKERGLTISFSSYTFPLDEPTHDDKRARLREKDRLNGSQKAGASSEESENYGNPLGSFRSALMSTRSSGFNVCTAGISQAALGANGDVYGCPRYVGAKPYVKGNVRERTILDIWNAPGWDFLREDYQPKLKLCNDCAYFDNCFYGKACRANPGYLFNDAYGVSPECILEYDRLELPYEKVKSYLEERIAENVGNDRIQRLCQRLLRDIAAKEARRQSATAMSVASTESAERAVT